MNALEEELRAKRLAESAAQTPAQEPTEKAHSEAQPVGQLAPSVPQGFDAVSYTMANPDVKTSGLNPYEHYVQQGQHQDRLLSPELPGASLQAVQTDLNSTVSQQEDVQQLSAPKAVKTPQLQNTGGVYAQGSDATTAATPTQVLAKTIQQITEAGSLAPTAAAQGTASQNTQASVEATTLSGNVEAATVNVTPEATVEAVVGTMSPEDLAGFAEVAGLHTARVNDAKRQLKKAGLTEEEITAIGSDPDLLEARLGSFTEEQLGMIGGLQVEALVSTQMESLLAGIENGEIPLWARPAVSAVEQMLARRGLTASTVGRDSLYNAIIQSALPLASQNAQAIQSSVQQRRDQIQQGTMLEAQLKQQSILQNAQNSFNLNLTNLNNEQQARVANAQFFQTVALTEASHRQQAAVQNAVNLTQLDIATVDQNTRIAIQNAESFLQMDMANLSARQQSIIIDAQYEQQRMLSNAAAQNAMKQFNASSENQVNMFMTELSSNIQQFNASQINAMRQFNASEANRAAAISSTNAMQAEQFGAQLRTQIEQFNSQQQMMTEQWNASNAQAIEQSNIQWRRQANTIDTAAQNAINQQNVQNAFTLTSQSQAAMWQELRDAATFTYQTGENRQDREAQLYAVALGNESAAARNYEQTTHLMNLAKTFFVGY